MATHSSIPPGKSHRQRKLEDTVHRVAKSMTETAEHAHMNMALSTPGFTKHVCRLKTPGDFLKLSKAQANKTKQKQFPSRINK